MSARFELLVLNERDPAHPRAGGAEIHVERIFSRLADRGHDVRWLATGFHGAARETRIGGIHIERLGPLPAYYARVPFRTRRFGGASDAPAVVIECLNKIPFYAPLYARVPVLALCHHLFGGVAFDQVAWPIAAGVVLCERGIRRAYRDVPFLAISESTAGDLVARGIEPDHVRVSPPGIDRPRRSVDPEAPRPARLTYVGRLEPYKRVDLMLRGAARLIERHPDLELVVIGKGSARARLEVLARSLGLGDRVRFTGFVADDERDAWIAGSRACVFPSEKEGWGLTVIEANALSTPVVARDAPGLRDSVRHGETGWLVASHADVEQDVEAWATALATALREDEQTRRMRTACLDWSQRFDWDRAADEMESAIGRAWEGHSR
jgi:glycosyltransferase involved in cell wall biosynthesis